MVRLGQLLHQQRLRKKLSLSEVAREIKIKEPFLLALEKGEYHRLPSPAYAKGFVTNYATYLGLPRTEVIALFRREFDEKKAFKVLPDSLSNRQQGPRIRIKIKDSLLLFVGIVFLFVAFLLFQYRAVFLSPPLRITTPEENAVVAQEIVVSGKTDSEASVTVNDEPVSLDEHGAFSKRIEFFPGAAEIVIKAKNRFGKETVVTRTISVKE